ncbi:phosphopantothenoylcysteine decarboxylase [Dyadobacter sp. 3J3]|uniref:phosphopantothenoylcysteine decarboxylase domain-containing protein n=1 Tax=Dyadobacter sp. 3J3 TaxID=2606600 RepID=UPI001358E987|nr:phosphopantothenoylcysteine decarboxylase [Dyadobacter sp. 3J3]
MSQKNNPDTFEDLKILISAGAAREAIDPVRFISNHSIREMDYAIVEKFFTKPGYRIWP